MPPAKPASARPPSTDNESEYTASSPTPSFRDKRAQDSWLTEQPELRELGQLSQLAELAELTETPRQDADPAHIYLDLLIKLLTDPHLPIRKLAKLSQLPLRQPAELFNCYTSIVFQITHTHIELKKGRGYKPEVQAFDKKRLS